MIEVALVTGLFGCLLTFLGFAGFLSRQVIILSTLVLFISLFILVYTRRRRVIEGFEEFKSLLKDKLSLFLVTILFIQMLINLIGAISPETAFDALWYHLTLPKLYLQHHQIFFIPGGLLYYSAMPKFGEILYTVAVALQGEMLAKVFHFMAGIGICVVLFQFMKKISDRQVAILSVVILSANLVFAWESTTAYIDLFRTFFELLSFVQLYEFIKKNNTRALYLSAIFLGFAILTKLIALGSLSISILFIWMFVTTLSAREKIEKSIIYISLSLLIPAPWLVFSTIHTGNPVYPFFTSLYPSGLSVPLLNPFRFITDLWRLFTHAADPISPMYLIFFPLLIVVRTRLKKISPLVMYAILVLFIWYVTPRTGGGRFILPYLPVWSGIVAYAIQTLAKERLFYRFTLGLVIVVSLITMGYRGIAEVKYLPVVFGRESSSEFLSSHLNFSFGDFYDTDGYFRTHIKSSDRVLLIGFHNLYYVDFPFVDSSWVKKADRFTYVATQHAALPKRFSTLQKVYENDLTGVQLYSTGGNRWKY